MSQVEFRRLMDDQKYQDAYLLATKMALSGDPIDDVSAFELMSRVEGVVIVKPQGFTNSIPGKVDII